MSHYYRISDAPINPNKLQKEHKNRNFAFIFI